MADYSKLDRFLATDTWHTVHPNDEKRFYLALQDLLQDDDFNPDEMAEYILVTKGIDPNDDDHPLHPAVDRLRASAWSVKDYLDAIAS